MKEILEMRGISKNFGSVQALSEVDFSLFSGEVHALMGENGAGKSTLMNILSGSIRNFEGEMLINGKKETIRSPLHARHLGIAKIHQELQLVKELSVADYIEHGRNP